MAGGRRDSSGSELRRWVVLTLALLSPFVLVGGVLTASIFGSFLGVPVLLATVPPVVWAVRVLRGRGGDRVRTLGWWMAGLTVAAGAILGTCIAVGADDLDSAAKVAPVAIPLAWVLLMGLAARALLRASRPMPARP